MGRKNRSQVEQVSPATEVTEVTQTPQVTEVAPVVETPQVEATAQVPPTPERPTMGEVVDALYTGAKVPHAHTGGGNRYNWSGISVAALLRWLGAKQLNVKTCRKVVDALYGPAVSDATVKTQRQLGKQGKGSKLPVLTDAQVAEVEKVIAA